MSYHLYHTPAFVLGSAPRGEGSKLVSLFTRELGFLTAIAQSAREERSKLRYGLQDFSYSDITLVRGKEFWRLTRAECVENVFEELQGSKEAVRMLGRIFSLLRRLLAGEERNEPLFVAVLEGVQFIKSDYSPFVKGSGESASRGILNPTDFVQERSDWLQNRSALDLSWPPVHQNEPPPFKKEEQIAGVEIVLVLRILYFLGYLAPRNEFDPFLSHANLWDESVISKALLFRTVAISEINNSLKESQL